MIDGAAGRGGATTGGFSQGVALEFNPIGDVNNAVQYRFGISGVHPGYLRFFTVAACTPYCRGDEIGELPVWITAGWRIARYSDPRGKGSVYGVKRSGRPENMAYIWTCTPC